MRGKTGEGRRSKRSDSPSLHEGAWRQSGSIFKSAKNMHIRAVVHMRRFAKLHGREKSQPPRGGQREHTGGGEPVLHAERKGEIATCHRAERRMDRASTEVWCLRVALGADERGVA